MREPMTNDTKQTIFWLYYEGDPILAVFLPEDATAEQVRTNALNRHRAFPQSDTVPPGMFERMLLFSDVRH